MTYTNEEYAKMAEKANQEGKLLKDVDGVLTLVEPDISLDKFPQMPKSNSIPLIAATPMISLFGNENFVEKDDLKKAGYGLVNNDAIGAIARRIDTGHYEIINTEGILKEDNAVEQSKDANGNVSCFIDNPTEDENHVITVRVYKKKWDMDLCAVVAGVPMDIPEGSQINIKLIMPTKDVNTNEEELETTKEEVADNNDPDGDNESNEDNALTKSVKKPNTKRNNKGLKENN